MLTEAAPASCVTSTTIFAPTSCARRATAATSSAVPVAYCTALTQTTEVELETASIKAAVRSVCGLSSTQRIAVPNLSRAASQGR